MADFLYLLWGRIGFLIFFEGVRMVDEISCYDVKLVLEANCSRCLLKLVELIYLLSLKWPRQAKGG